MEIITGQRAMDAKPILDYFKPLIEWLKEDNKRHNVTVGWKQGYKFNAYILRLYFKQLYFYFQRNRSVSVK